MKIKLSKIQSSWYVWLFPAIAVVISGFLLYSYYKSHGPVVKIYFDNASGIQAEKTKVRFRGVPIGTVRDVYLSEDMKDVVAEVTLRKDAAQFAVEGTKFSLVVPKVTLQGISGLETVFEGTYISVLPGDTSGEAKTEFKAKADAEDADLQADTSSYWLETNNVESINPNDSVTFRGLKIGSVSKMALTKDSQTILVQINIDNKYTKLIRTNTVFWRKVAVQAKLGLFKSEIKVNSLDSIMNSGIELATPNAAGTMAKGGHRFALVADAPKDAATWNPKLEFN